MSLTFDATFYQSHRPDVYNAFVATAGSTGLTWAQFAEQHYDTFGRFEGSDPSASFNTSYYLSTYPDVAAAGINPLTHFQQFGSLEDRQPFVNFPNIANGQFVPATYAAANPDLAAAGITSDAALYQHFALFGQFESRPGAPTVTTPGSGAGQTFVFTTTVGEAFVGTDEDDVFSATADAAGLGATAPGVPATLNPTDSADGGAGTDTMNIIATSAASPIPATISNIEIINLISNVAGNDFNDGVAGTTILNAGNFSGVTQLWQIGAATPDSVTGVTDSVTVGFNATAALNDIQMATGATTANVALANVATGGTINIGETTAGTLTTANINGSTAAGGTVNVNLDTAANTGGAAASAETTVNVGLTSNSTVAITSATATTIDGSASTGALTITASAAVTSLTGGSGADNLTGVGTSQAILGGGGNDNITAGNVAGEVITGGANGSTVNATAPLGTAPATLLADAIALGGGGQAQDVVTNAGESGLTFNTSDFINGFVSGEDDLDFNLAAGSGTNFLNGGVSSSYTDALTNANTAMNGTIQYFASNDGTNTYVFVDNDLDGTADMGVSLAGVIALVAGDIIA